MQLSIWLSPIVLTRTSASEDYKIDNLGGLDLSFIQLISFMDKTSVDLSTLHSFKAVARGGGVPQVHVHPPFKKKQKQKKNISFVE